MIPKRLIYVWLGEKKYPKNFERYKENWLKLNPEFEILEINESNFDINCCKFSKKAYKRGEMAFVSDVARIWAINKYGGVYLDTDVELRKSLIPFLKYNQFWAEEEPGLINSGLTFGSVPNNIVLEKILDYYKKIDFDSVDYLKNITTVKVVTKVLKEFGLETKFGNQLLPNNIKIFDPVYFAPFHYWGGGRLRDETVGIHHYDASWVLNNKNKRFKYFAHQLMFYFPLIHKIIDKL